MSGPAVSVPPLHQTVFRERPDFANRNGDTLVGRSERALNPIWVGSYLLVLLAVWSITGRYRGIVHDAIVYTLQAVARLQPDPLAGDVFLRYQSQDQFTIFPSVYAFAIELVGVDIAAAGLTIIILCGWYVVAWGISRTLQGPSLALLSLATLLFIPGIYGAKRVFRYAEPFITARSLAELLSLAAMLALLRTRYAWSVVLILPALLVHPLMAFPVAALMAVYCLPLVGWRRWTMATLALVSAAILGSIVLGLPDPFIRGDWLETTSLRSSFLFTNQWSAADWEIPAQVLLTLLLGVAVLPITPARRLLAGAMCVGVAGVLLAIVSSQVIELKILMQGQPWRWLWVGRFLATALLPLIVVRLWQADPAGRPAAIIVCAAWLLTGAGSFADIPPVGVSGLMCLIAVLIWHARTAMSKRMLATLNVMSVAVALLVAGTFISAIAIAAGNEFTFGYDPFWIQRVSDVVKTPGLAVSVAATAWYVLVVRRSHLSLVVLGVASLAVLMGSGPESMRSWTRAQYDEQQRETFAHWRSIIPRHAEVLWPAGAGATWFLLDRRSYLTITQGAGSVFSREASEELRRRANVLAPLVAPGSWFLDPTTKGEKTKELTPEVLQSICVDESLGFVVSDDRLDQAVATADWPTKGQHVYLYNCAPLRSGPGA